MPDLSSLTEYFFNAQEEFSTSLSASISNSDTTIGLDSVSGYSNGDVVALTIEPDNSTKKEVVVGTVDTANSRLTSAIRGVEGTAQSHTGGVTVADYIAAAHQEAMTTGLLVEHNPEGTHGDITATNLAIDGSVNSYPPVGSITDFAGSSAPTGWLLCYGQALNAATNTEYQALYDVIGNTYGGSDNTDFVVPDLRGRVIAGQDDMGGTSADRLTGLSGGVDGDTLGDTGGAETHTLVTAEMPNHTHSIGGSFTNNRVTSVATGSANNAGVVDNQDLTSGSKGGGGAHNNVQPTIILNKIIKY